MRLRSARTTTIHAPVEDVVRRADYEALIDGKFEIGSRETLTFCVYTVDLDAGRGDLYVAAGLGLALVERGFGVRLRAPERWLDLEPSDVVVGMLPEFDPANAGAAWTVAWSRNNTDVWCGLPHLTAYDQVIASSQLAVNELRRAAPHAAGVLPIGVDTDLFTPPAEGSSRASTAVTSAHFWGTIRDVHQALTELPDDADVAMFGNVAKGAPPELQRWVRGPVSYFALPDIYRQVDFVIDDMNLTTVGYGSVNSRFFEAAACGALPLANGSLGAIGLGFTNMPRYLHAADLAQQLRELRADAASTALRASAVAEEVRAHHSWRDRAAVFDELVVESRRHGAVSRRRRPIHFFPDYSDNRYQAMLYSRLTDIGSYAEPIGIGKLNCHLRERAEGPEPGLLHLHWTAPILQLSAGPFSAKLALDQFTTGVRAFKAAGGRLVWTIHNALPHDTRHRWAEIELAQFLVDEADAVHVLTEATFDEVRALYTLDRSNVSIIEIASYLGEYPDWVSRESARRRLGLEPDEKVLIALGGIRPYKGLDRLLSVFEDLAEKDSALRLLIAGRPGRQPGIEKLRNACENSPRVVAHFDYLPDDHLQVWLGAADLAVLPYRAVLNSSAFKLAETFGLPVLAPRTGALLAEEGRAHVRLFDPGTDESFVDELESAIHDFVTDPAGAESARAASRASAARFTAADMGARFAEFVAPFLAPDGEMA